MTRAPSSRSSRRRLLSIGAASHSHGNVDAPQIVANVFEALGEVAVAPASSPIEAILIPLPSPDEIVDLVRAADSIRRLDPTVQLVAVVDQPPVSEIQAHVDFQVARPIDTKNILDLLDGRMTPTQAAPNDAVPEPTSDDRPIQPPASEISSSRDSWIPVTPDASEGGFGDTDLVEALLYSPKQMRERAVHIISQQTGITDLQLMESEAAGTAPVRFAGKTFGHLQAPNADGDELKPWANWLARWLALEDAQSTLRQMAYRDELTGAWNRRYLNHFLSESIEESKRLRRQLTVMVFDIDDFKSFNDHFGHDAGDIILRETIRLLGSVIRNGDRVCRIGGDEFAVVFADLEAPRSTGSTHPDSVEKIARRFQAQIGRMRFPRLGLQAPGTLSVSGGLASYPWDASDPAGLLHAADQRALESKRRGKNFLTIGPGASFTREDDTPPSPTGPPA
ncbi:MAG: GGDEF domain-containing protein [Phycisphaerales bacterium]|nr:GGDEF domain-containing protein [Phycisphaerales bacterium]